MNTGWTDELEKCKNDLKKCPYTCFISITAIETRKLGWKGGYLPKIRTNTEFPQHKMRLHDKGLVKYLKIFFARTSKTSHFRSILSLADASPVLSGKLPFTDSFPFLFTLPSIELMRSLFEFTRTEPPKLVRGFRSTGEDIVALWKDADPSSTGCSTVPRTYKIYRRHVYRYQKKGEKQMHGLEKEISWIGNNFLRIQINPCMTFIINCDSTSLHNLRL